MPRKPSDKKAQQEIAQRFGDALRTARDAAGLTQEALAELIDLTPEAYGRLERGAAMPSYPTLFRLCRSLGVTANELLMGTGVLIAQEDSPSVELTELRRHASKLTKRQQRILLAVVREMADLKAAGGQ